MEFDIVKTAPCLVEDTESVDPSTCLTGGGGGGTVVPPSDDDRCADPAFADANPSICAGYPRLILKPEYALTESGKTVQYSTYVRTTGAEQLLTLGLAYKVSNPAIAMIQIDSGLATGVQGGIVTVSVTWQNLSAFAQLEVVQACSENVTNFLMLLDDSSSMKVGFNSTYSSRLSYAKAASNQFIETVNLSKDKVAVHRFDTGGVSVQGFSDDLATLESAVNSIVATANKTSLYDGLKSAIDAQNAASGATKVIVMFSDGENNTGDDPIPLAKSFKDAGGFILVVATRAWGTFFDTLYKIASAGFFLSAYGVTAENIITTLVNIKSYICSGDCPPTAGTRPTAQLNYTGFINWDVYQGVVDLCGLGTWDMLPENGLYVDLSGTGLPGADTTGGLLSKTDFTFVAGQTYQFKIRVAGNQRNISEEEAVKVTIGGFYTATFTPTDYLEDFVLHTASFTPGVGGTAKIQIEMISISSNSVGPFIDTISLENTTTSTVMLNDNFDNENIVTTPVTPNYGYGCLVSPPGAQSADPTPPPVFLE